jgi:hypothetical protein
MKLSVAEWYAAPGELNRPPLLVISLMISCFVESDGIFARTPLEVDTKPA